MLFDEPKDTFSDRFALQTKCIDLPKCCAWDLEPFLQLENHSHNLELQVLAEYYRPKRPNLNTPLELKFMI